MTTNNQPGNGQHYERVLAGCECPRCGEDDIDALVWIDDEQVRYTRCQCVYEPGQRDGG